MKRLLAVATAIGLVSSLTLFGQDRIEAELAKGIREAQVGEFDNAIVILDAVTKELRTSGGRPKELARGYLYLSISYLGLSQEQMARAHFLEAWRMDEGMELSPTEFPPKVLRFLEELRKETLAATAPAPKSEPALPSPAPVAAVPVASPVPTAATRSGPKVPLILAGVAAAGGAAVLATRGGSDSGSPGPSPTPSGTGFTILSTTTAGELIPLSRPITGNGTPLPRLVFQFNSNQDLPAGPLQWSITLSGSISGCLATQNAYSQRLDAPNGSPYVAGTNAQFSVNFWVIQPGSGTTPTCGASFTTDRLIFCAAGWTTGCSSTNVGWRFSQ